MSSIEAIDAMLEVMPEESRLKVKDYTQELLESSETGNPFGKVSAEQILSDLDESQRQVENGKARPMEETLNDLEKKYGFV